MAHGSTKQRGTNKTTDAITNTATLKNVLSWLEGRESRDVATKRIIACYCKLAALTGLRYSDLSTLKFSQCSINGVWRSSLTVVQTKILNLHLSRDVVASKARKKAEVHVHLSSQAHDVLEELSVLQSGDLLFESQARNAKEGQVISDRAIRNVLKDCANDLKLDFKLSVHSFRKTLGTILINEHKHSITSVRDRLGHANASMTSDYIKKYVTPELATEMSI